MGKPAEEPRLQSFDCPGRSCAQHGRVAGSEKQSYLRTKGVLHLLRQVGINLIRDVGTLILKQVETYKNHARRYDLSEIVPNYLTVTPIVSKSGLCIAITTVILGT